jgi:hypothetical protein
LVEGLFALIVAAAQSCAALASYRIDFVNKNNAGLIFFGLLEEVPHAACTHADKHFYKVRTADGKERKFASPLQLCKQRFAVPGGPTNNTPLEFSPPQSGTSWGFQKFYDLFELFFFFFCAGNIIEPYFTLVLTRALVLPKVIALFAPLPPPFTEK